MATCTSASSITRSWEHDVFLSFRGEDTRNSFIGYLYRGLVNKGIRTFKDDKKLEIGKPIAIELLNAIEKSRFAVVVLSSNFATSKWCLEEIVKIVDCMEQGKLIVIPVFYHVSPSDVRHQSNCFEQDFSTHEKDPEIIPEKVEKWRAAFRKSGAISGSHVTRDMDESEFVDKLVSEILEKMQDALSTDVPNRGLVGIEERIKEVETMLDLESSEVRFIGICGMSGMGKTTLAEAVYKGIQRNFQKSSFIENIKEVSKKNDSTNLREFQEKLLKEILSDNIHVQSVAHGETLLGTMLRGLKVMIVLDDVNHVDQLTYLAGSREWFGPSSRIIVTTTDINLLLQRQINKVYTCEKLEDAEALRLFYQSAFEEPHPTHGYEKLSDDIVKLAGGLPLALNVYGSLLRGKEENYWKDTLRKLQAYPLEQVLERLETVYARLDRDQQNTFIYIACFLKGRSRKFVADILTNLCLNPGCGIPDLINKFLITVNHDDSVWVHDLLQQMCWEVLRKESERYNGKLIAMKYRKDVEDTLSNELQSTGTVEIINQEPYKGELDNYFDERNSFSKMVRLKFLRISNINFPQGLDRLSNDIRILEWYGCSLKSLPSTFKPKNIFELEMCCSQLETLWEKDLDLPNLRSINLSFSKDLTEIPDLTSTSTLEKLNLEGCTKLMKLHESVLLHKRVRYMNLKGCIRLQSLGSTMEMEDLEALILSDCSTLECIPEFGLKMQHLEHLYVDGTKIKKLPDNLGQMCDLKKLDVSGTCIEELPSSIHHLKRLRLLCVRRCILLSSKNEGFLHTNLNTISSGLRELDLSDCKLSTVPDGIGLLHHLISLDLSGNDFDSLPASVSLLSNLRILCLNNCRRLQSLPALSLVNVDSDYGPRIRFSYFISRELVDVTKFHDKSNYSSPIVSCLNCPELAKNESSNYLAEKILNSYLQLRTNEFSTPEAVFKIVGAGSEIPSGFLLPGSNDLIHEGPWIGMAICVVISVHNMDDYMKAKYAVTVRIHFGKHDSRIVVPIDFGMAGLESQLLIYWTVVDDLQRNLDMSRRNNVSVSFAVEPAGDDNLQVTKFGVRVIRDEDILQLKRYGDSTNEAVHYLFQATLSFHTDMQWYICACEANMDLLSSHSIIHDLTGNIIKLILNYDNQKPKLGDIQKVIICLLEINQEILSKYMKEWNHTQLLPLVYEYYGISHGISKLYNDFVRLLKDISGSWLTVKLALEQIEVKGRTPYYTYEEMLNDLEAAKSVRFSDKFITFFAYICKQTVSFSRKLNKEIQSGDKKKVKLVHALAKVSSVTIAGVFSVVATCMGDSELLQEMKDINSYSMWLHLIQRLSRQSDKWFQIRGKHLNASYKRELQIWDFDDNAIFLRELRKKLVRLTSATERNEVLMATIDKMEKNNNVVSGTIEDMCSNSRKYSHFIRDTGITLSHFLGGGILQVPILGVLFKIFKSDEVPNVILYKDPMNEVATNLIRATILLSADLEWFLRSLPGIDREMVRIKMPAYPTGCLPFLYVIHRIFNYLLLENLKFFKFVSVSENEWRQTHLSSLFNDYYEIFPAISELYHDFVRLLRYLHRSRSSLRLQEIHNFERIESIVTSYRFADYFAFMCEKKVAFLKHFNQEIQGNENIKSVNRLAQISTVTILEVFCAMAAYTGDEKLFQEMNDSFSDSKWSQLTQSLSERGYEYWSNMEGRQQLKTNTDWEEMNDSFSDSKWSLLTQSLSEKGYEDWSNMEGRQQLKTNTDWKLRIRDFYENISLVPELN